MKKLLALLLALLLTASFVACNGNEQKETTPDETEPETVAQTTPEPEPTLVELSRFAHGKKASVVYKMPSGDTHAMRTLNASLQGLSAKLSDVQILLDGGSIDKMMEQIERVWGVPVEETMNGEAVTTEMMLKHYYENGVLSSYIYFDQNIESTYYVAASLAGVTNSVLACAETKPLLDSLGYTCLLDVTDKDDAWLRQSEYWDLINKEIAIEQPYGLMPDLHDYGIMNGSYINFYRGHNEDEHIAMYGFLDDNAIVFGWNNTLTEGPTVTSLSLNNIVLIPSDYACNMSTLSGFAVDSFEMPRTVNAATEAENVHTVCLVVSDGDNIQYIINAMQSDSLYGARGKIDMGWGFPASSIDTIPPMVSYLYESMTEKDEFVIQLGGIGYTYPSYWDKEARLAMIDDLELQMERLDVHYLTILDPTGWDTTVLSDFTARDVIKGIIYPGFDGPVGNILWTNGKPAVVIRGNLGAGTVEDSFSESEVGWAKMFLTRDSLCTDVTDEKAYSIYYVQCWNYNVPGVAGLLNVSDKVEFVTPTEFFDRLTANCKPEADDYLINENNPKANH